MIDFLLGAMSVLTARGNKIISHLQGKPDLPQSVLQHCLQIADKTRAILRSMTRRQQALQFLKEKVEQGYLSLNQAEPILRGSLRAYRDNRRDLDAYEEFFVGHINRFIPADGFLSIVAEAIWKETGLPGISPVAVTSTSGYFCTVASLGIVFCPPSAEDHMLIWPDFYHESGHIIPERISKPLYGPRFSQALQDHAKNLINQIRRTSRPLNKDEIKKIITTWRQRWAEEVACDTLAARLVGPAYGWCNLHLCLQSPNVYEFGVGHPADVARTRHIFRVLKRCGWVIEVAEMETRWDHYVKAIKQRKTPYYEDYHPPDLFIAVTEDVEESTRSLVSYDPQGNTTARILNTAWQQFLDDPVGYTPKEEQMLSALRHKLMNP